MEWWTRWQRRRRAPRESFIKLRAAISVIAAQRRAIEWVLCDFTWNQLTTKRLRAHALFWFFIPFRWWYHHHTMSCRLYSFSACFIHLPLFCARILNALSTVNLDILLFFCLSIKTPTSHVVYFIVVHRREHDTAWRHDHMRVFLWLHQLSTIKRKIYIIVSEFKSRSRFSRIKWHTHTWLQWSRACDFCAQLRARDIADRLFVNIGSVKFSTKSHSSSFAIAHEHANA